MLSTLYPDTGLKEFAGSKTAKQSMNLQNPDTGLAENENACAKRICKSKIAENNYSI
jgi:hypothetical protein